MFDTNVWSMLGRTGGGPALYAYAQEHNFEIVLAPSILLELARSSNVDASRRDLQAMLSGPRTQLPTEAELTATDLINEMRRMRPA